MENTRVKSFSDEKLEYLYLSNKLGTMRAAADSLGLAPSSVSRQISQLEKNLGINLVEKRSHKFRLSEAGRCVIEYYKENLSQRAVLQTKLGDLNGVKSGHYTLAVGEGFISTVLLSTLDGFTKKYPNIRLDVVTATTHEVLGMISNDEAHLGFVFDSEKDPRIRVRLSVSQPLKVVIAKDHTLAKQPMVTLADIVDFPLILPRKSFRIREILVIAGKSEDIYLQPSIETNSLLLMRELVRNGDGVTILSDLSITGDLTSGQLVSVPINNPVLSATCAEVVTRLGRQLPSGAEAILRMLSNNLSKERNLS